jgi:CRISPR-associated endonuclease/helicase Cas3
MNFDEWFSLATGKKPFPYQASLAQDPVWPELLDVPTGLGKTAAVIAGWRWRRRHHPDSAVRSGTPRRLIYCLPMRVLVKQTYETAIRMLAKTGELAGTAEWAPESGRLQRYEPRYDDARVSVHLLMGGDVDTEWERHPERDLVLIGTQDQLLSRALNRGYAMSRYKWPVHFGFVSNDALWVMDETQLMGVGVETSAQLQGLRAKLGAYGPAKSLWVSATLDAAVLSTVDHPAPQGGFARVTLGLKDQSVPEVAARTTAKKQLRKADVARSKTTAKTYAKDLAHEVLAAHVSGTLTLVIVNRVLLAQELYTALEKTAHKARPGVALALVHARMRPADREVNEAVLQGHGGALDRIVVATQAVEAGVDVSARTLFSELAPWPSLVQRFGRCNRYGEYDAADTVWVDVAASGDKDPLALPYDAPSLDASRQRLEGLSDVGPAALKAVAYTPPKVIRPVLRRRDLIDLFDTTPDLSGNDLDVSQYIREGEDNDVQVFWRVVGENAPANDLPGPRRDELCAVSIGAMLAFCKDERRAWVWNALEGGWQKLRQPRPGMTVLFDAGAGGYSAKLGWTGSPKDTVAPLEAAGAGEPSNDGEPDTFIGRWVRLTDHARDIVTECRALVTALLPSYPAAPWLAVETAARWHDVGKAHEAFQNMLRTSAEPPPAGLVGPWAKSSAQRGRAEYFVEDGAGKQSRRGFRHELASALAWLQSAPEEQAEKNLVAYLVAAHHGKVRLSIRSLPNEMEPPDPQRIFARGIWNGDPLPKVDLGDGVVVEPLQLSLGYMNLGEGEHGQSWVARMLGLRDHAALGIFRLALLESLVRVADWRASSDLKGGRHVEAV